MNRNDISHERWKRVIRSICSRAAVHFCLERTGRRGRPRVRDSVRRKGGGREKRVSQSCLVSFLSSRRAAPTKPRIPFFSLFSIIREPKHNKEGAHCDDVEAPVCATHHSSFLISSLASANAHLTLSLFPRHLLIFKQNQKQNVRHCDTSTPPFIFTSHSLRPPHCSPPSQSPC